MESVYSRFYFPNSSKNVGTWNTYPQVLNHSSSSTLFNSYMAPPLPGVLQKSLHSCYTNNSNSDKVNEALKMQLLEQRVKRIQEKDAQVNQMQALYSNSQYLPHPVYYPLIFNSQKDVSEEPKKKKMKKIKVIKKIKVKRKKEPITPEQAAEIEQLKKDLMTNDKTNIAVCSDALKNYNKPKEEEKTESDNGELSILKKGKNFFKLLNDNSMLKLQNDNFKSREEIHEIKKNYNEIKNILENKLSSLELQQKMEIAHLKYALEQGGNPRIKASLKNTYEGTNIDLDKIPDHTIPPEMKNVTKYIDEKIRAYELQKQMEREKKEEEERDIRNKVADEIALQKSLYFQKSNSVTHLPSISYYAHRVEENNFDSLDIANLVESRVKYILEQKDNSKEMERLLQANEELMKREDLLMEELKKERQRREEEERMRRYAEMNYKQSPPPEPQVVLFRDKPKEVKKKKKVKVVPKKEKVENVEPKKEEEPKVEEEPKKEEEPKLEEEPKKEEEPKLEEEPKMEEEPKLEEEPKKEEEPNKEEEPKKEDEEEPKVEEEPKAVEVKPMEMEPKKKKKKKKKIKGYQRLRLGDIYPDGEEEELECTPSKKKKKKKKKQA